MYDLGGVFTRHRQLRANAVPRSSESVKYGNERSRDKTCYINKLYSAVEKNKYVCDRQLYYILFSTNRARYICAYVLSNVH